MRYLTTSVALLAMVSAAVCHPLARTRWIAMYGVDTASDAKRRAFLDRVAKRVS